MDMQSDAPAWLLPPPPGFLSNAQRSRRRCKLRAYFSGHVRGGDLAHEKIAHENAASRVEASYQQHRIEQLINQLQILEGQLQMLKAAKLAPTSAQRDLDARIDLPTGIACNVDVGNSFNTTSGGYTTPREWEIERMRNSDLDAHILRMKIGNAEDLPIQWDLIRSESREEAAFRIFARVARYRPPLEDALLRTGELRTAWLNLDGDIKDIIIKQADGYRATAPKPGMTLPALRKVLQKCGAVAKCKGNQVAV